VRNTPNEELLWSYTVQLAAILRAAHATGLALRPAALSASKVRRTAAVKGAARTAAAGVRDLQLCCASHLCMLMYPAGMFQGAAVWMLCLHAPRKC
jgi:hypothetical protein